MRSRLNRTTAAMLLTGLAVTVPCGAWFVVGSRETAREADRLAEQPVHEARAAAGRAAERLTARLESLVQVESRRPFDHYASASSPTAPKPCACAPDPISPLAQGLRDPLARAHFQIDAVGRLTLPTLDGATPAVANGDGGQDVLESLECAAPETLPASYAKPDHDAKPVAEQEQAGGVILVDPFTWHTVELADRPTLVAIREVHTLGAVLTQGFVVASDVLERELAGQAYPMRLVNGTPPEAATAAALPIEGARWHVLADASQELALAAERARDVRRSFRTTFALGALAALLAGVSVVGLVWQSERLAAERSRFAAVAAHELRTPLTGLRMYGEMLAGDLGEPGKRHEYSRRIADEAARLGRVVGNVLGYARLEHGNPALRLEPGDAGAAVVEVVEAARPALEGSGSELRVSIEEGLPAVRFDRDALAQLVQNLLDNAEKHTRGSANRTIEVKLHAQDGGVALTVRDHGPGVPRRIRRRMFRPFVRDGEPGMPSGIGLGLAMVDALARGHGATLAYRDAEAGGASFTVTFPAATG